MSSPTSSEHYLRDTLQYEYGVRSPFSLTRIYDGRALNYRVSGHDGNWLLKIFQSDYDLGRVNLASRFVDYLAAEHCPVKPFWRTVGGALVSVCGGRPAVLVRWINGQTPLSNTLDKRPRLFGLGRLCGLLNRIAKDFPEAKALETQDTYDPLSHRVTNLEQNTADARAHDSDINQEVIRRLRIVDEIGDDLCSSEKESVKQAIHGDFYCVHSVWQEDTVVGLIDAMGGCHFPGWELMRCFFQSIPFDPQTSNEDIGSLWEPFIHGYCLENKLASRDVEVAYDIYLLNLTLSSYGLRLPPHASWHKDESARRLRRFGQWRSATAEYLASRRESLRPLLAAKPLGDER